MELFVGDRVRLQNNKVGNVTRIWEDAITLIVQNFEVEVPLEAVISVLPPQEQDINYSDETQPFAQRIGGPYLWKLGYLQLVDYYIRTFGWRFNDAWTSIDEVDDEVVEAQNSVKNVRGMYKVPEVGYYGPIRFFYGDSRPTGNWFFPTKTQEWVISFSRPDNVVTLDDFALLAKNDHIEGISVATSEKILTLLAPSGARDIRRLEKAYFETIARYNENHFCSGPIVQNVRIPGNISEEMAISRLLAENLGWEMTEIPVPTER